MKVTFNEASLSHKMSSLDGAANVFWQLYMTYCELEKVKKITQNVSLYGKKIYITEQVAQGGKTILDIKKVWEAQHKNAGTTAFSGLISMLGRFASFDTNSIPNMQFVLDNISFQIPKDEADTMLLSLATIAKYENLFLEGSLDDGSSLKLKNIAKPIQIENHRVAFGIRRYERNPKHKAVYTSMGNGELSSPMDLSDEEAQELLNGAIRVGTDRALYATRQGKCYAFREHEPGKAIYHGYLVERPSDKVQRELGLK